MVETQMCANVVCTCMKVQVCVD